MKPIKSSQSQVETDSYGSREDLYSKLWTELSSVEKTIAMENRGCKRIGKRIMGFGRSVDTKFSAVAPAPQSRCFQCALTQPKPLNSRVARSSGSGNFLEEIEERTQRQKEMRPFKLEFQRRNWIGSSAIRGRRID
jgi:hypothetical protein